MKPRLRLVRPSDDASSDRSADTAGGDETLETAAPDATTDQLGIDLADVSVPTWLVEYLDAARALLSSVPASDRARAARNLYRDAHGRVRLRQLSVVEDESSS